MKIHDHENNPASQAHLNENSKHFSQQCLKVLELLRQGKRLTTMNAPGYGILSLPRRLKDLKDFNGIRIDWRWTNTNGTKVKEWFLNPKTETENLYLTGKSTAADHSMNILKQAKLL